MAENESLEKPLSTGEWFLSVFILALPVVGLVMYLVWAFGPGNAGRRNFCRAMLLWFAVLLAIGCVALVVFLLLGGTLAALANQRLAR
jgi:hypothetical protein